MPRPAHIPQDIWLAAKGVSVRFADDAEVTRMAEMIMRRQAGVGKGLGRTTGAQSQSIQLFRVFPALRNVNPRARAEVIQIYHVGDVTVMILVLPGTGIFFEQHPERRLKCDPTLKKHQVQAHHSGLLFGMTMRALAAAANGGSLHGNLGTAVEHPRRLNAAHAKRTTPLAPNRKSVIAHASVRRIRHQGGPEGFYFAEKRNCQKRRKHAAKTA